jgi:small redox-active disulfide protein 2
MINIKILGSGCANCKRLEQITRKLTEENHLEAEFEKVTDMAQIMNWPILSTPGLVINDTVVSSGRIPTEEEIEGWLKSA